MIRKLTDNPLPLVGLILAQSACAGFFVWDVILDGGQLPGLFPIDIHFLIEAGAVLGLIAGIVVEMRVLFRLLARKAHLERQVSMAQSAFHDLIEAHFEGWGLTAAEADIAWFTVKGLSIAEIAQMRGSAEGTVKSHLNAIYRKADVTNRGALLALLIDDLMDGTRPERAGAACAPFFPPRAHASLAPSVTRAAMTNGLAIFLAICIAGFLALDALLWDWTLSLFLARRFTDLLNWMAFWR